MEIVNIIFKIIFCFSCGWAIASCIIIDIHIGQIKKAMIKICDASSVMADDNIELINMIKDILKENRALQSKIKQLEANKLETKK